MNITFFIGSLTGGGAERVTCNLANFLNSNNNIEVVTMSDVEDTYKLSENIKKIPLIRQNERRNSVYDFVLRFFRLAVYMKKKKPDCYVVMLPITTIMMLLLRGLTKSKIIVSERNDPKRNSRLINFLLKLLSRRADGYVFQTEDAKKWYKDIIGNIKCEVIPNAVNQEFIDYTFTGNKSDNIVSVGRLTKQKNISLLIDSFNLIKDSFPDVNLEIYGEGEERVELETKIKNYGLESRVVMPGYVSDVKDKIAEAGIFVITSDFEGIPNALIEAMALGTPCISTDCPVGGPKMLIENGENGLLVPVNDKNAVAEAMCKLLSDKDYADKLAKNAKKISDKLSPDIIYTKWNEFIKEIAIG